MPMLFAYLATAFRGLLPKDVSRCIHSNFQGDLSQCESVTRFWLVSECKSRRSHPTHHKTNNIRGNNYAVSSCYQSR